MMMVAHLLQTELIRKGEHYGERVRDHLKLGHDPRLTACKGKGRDSGKSTWAGNDDIRVQKRAQGQEQA